MTAVTANPPKPPEPEDEVEKSRAPLLEHLTELRTRLIRSAGALFVAFFAVFFVAKPIYLFLLKPYEAAARRYQDVGDADIQIIFTGPLEFFFVQMQLALLGALAVAFPIIAWQIYAFVAPGLYKRERGALIPFLLAMPVLFMLGAATVYYIVLPLVMNFSLSQQVEAEGMRVALLLRVADYFKLATALILAFGSMFQMPIVLTLLGKAGVVSAKGLRKAWKFAVVGVFVAAAIVTPPDVISQIILAVPMLLLYEVSILAVKLVERGRARRDAEAAKAS